ncbi:MAG TPA: hypothetical protein VNK95_07160, partial [Caldilineaceae bacterium]|nr:hypothetical protein [Caldilineaceae bacterium]
MQRNVPPHSRHQQRLRRLLLVLWLTGLLLQPAPSPLLAAGDSPFSSAAVEHLVIPPDGPAQMPVLYVHGWSDDGALFARGQREKCYDPSTQKKPSGTTYLAGAGLENWIVQWWSTDSDGFAEPGTTADMGYAFLVSAQEAEDQSVWMDDGDYTLQNRPCPGALDLLLANPLNDISNVLIANTYNDSGRVSEHAKDLLDLLRGEQRPGGRLEGARQVNIITHSKGSLVARAMLHMAAQNGPQDAERVANAVYNAPPFAGSSVAPLAITLFFETPLDPEDIFLDEWFIESYGTLLIGEPVGEVIEILLDDLLRISGIEGGLDAVALVLPPGSLSILEILKTEAWDVAGRAFWGEFAETEEAEAVMLLIELIRPLVTAFMGFPAAPALYDLPPDAYHVTQYNNTGYAKQFITYGTGPVVDFGATLFPCRADGPFTNPTLPCADAIAADPSRLGNPDDQLRNYDDVVVAQGSAILLSQTDGFGPRMTLLDSATVWHGDTVDDPTVFGPKWLEALLAPPTSLVLDGLIEPVDTAQRSYVVSTGTQFSFSSQPTRVQHSASGPAAFSFDVTVSAAAYQYRVVKLDGSGSPPSDWVQVGTNGAVSFETLRTTYGLDNVPFALEWRSINGRGGREHIRSARFVIAPPAPQIVSDQILTPNPAEVHRRPISELYGRAVRGTILAQLNNPLLPIIQSNPEAQWVLRAPANKAYVAVFSHRGGVDYAWDDPNLSNPTRQENVAALTLPLAGLSEGLHRLTFETFNAVGERSPRQHIFFLVDNTPPAVTFQASANHALGYLVGLNTPLSYSVHDVASNGGTGSLNVPGHPAGVIPPDTVFTLGETTLDEQGKAAGQVGAQVTLNATGRDWVNNSTTTSIQVYYDWTPPAISLVEVDALPTAGGYRTFTDTVHLTLNITEQGAGLLPVVAHPLTADGNQLVSDPFVLGGNGGFPNAFAGTVRLAPGLNTVTVVAQDSVGNSSTLSLQIEYNQAPFDQEPLELMTPRLNIKCYSPTGAPATCIPGTINKWNSSFYGDVFAFSSQGNAFVQEDTNGVEDIFVWRNGSLLRASVNAEGEQANDDSSHPAVSGNGRYVYFRSQAT